MRDSSRKPTPDRAKRETVRSRSSTGWHELNVDEALRLLEVRPEMGLTSAEAGRRLDRFGPNRISAPRGPSRWWTLLRQFHQPLVYILLVATGVTMFLGEWVDASVILGVVIANAIIGYAQEAKAERAIDSLSRMVVTKSTVRREGHAQRVRSEELVPGDVILLGAGDRVPADLRLLRVKNLQIDESALTGESVPVHKHADSLEQQTILADRKNLAFAGTLVTAGQGEGAVWATGDATETGHVARLIADAVDLATPLTRKIAELSRTLLWVILGFAAVTVVVGILRGGRAVEIFMAAVALAVGAIPEGLPAAVTIVLAVGVARMARRRAIIRKLPAVETLGSTTIICSDKTGTLTENQMTVREIFAGGELFEVTGAGYEPRGEFRRGGARIEPAKFSALAECLRAGVLCNDARLSRQDGRAAVHGDPTEAALLVAGEKAGIQRSVALVDAPRLDVLPFESVQMYRATLHDAPSGRIIYKVGAAERIVHRCVDALNAAGEPAPLDKNSILRVVEEMAARGLRVLALVRMRVPAHHATLEHRHVADGLTFLGLQGMIDPPRPEVIAAVRRCHEAGIAVKMITGDHLVTARAIARQIGLSAASPGGEIAALSGRDLEKIADADLPSVIARTAVFARVAPEQKLRLVRAFQSQGHIVAVTGDGVNDAPALKQADIGIAMGLGGTDVAKGAAAMVLTDDNFATIEAAVEEGRGVYDNLIKFLVCELPTNGGEGLILLTAIFLGMALPALPVQFLWVNLTTSVCLGLALVFEPKELGLMRRPPRDPRRPMLSRSLLMRTVLVSCAMLAGAYWLFLWELGVEGASLAAARTAVVNVIVVVETAYLFNCRSLEQSPFAIGMFANGWAVAGATAMVLAQIAFTYLPVMNTLFHSAPIAAESWLRIASVGVALFALVEFEKWLRFGRGPSRSGPPE